jgi:hypothetical protein
VAALKAQIADLKKRLAALEEELGSLELPPAARSDLEPLRGTWTQTNAMKVWTYTFEGRTLRQRSTAGVDVTVTITLNEQAEPRIMRWRDPRGVKTTCLYKVEGNRLVMVWGPAVQLANYRKLQDGPNVFFMEFRRVR